VAIIGVRHQIGQGRSLYFPWPIADIRNIPPQPENPS
jgi:hypothetical protein